MKPKISVVLPVYNADKYLEEAINSILKQTFRDFELIIIDDGSSDNSLKIIKKKAKHDSRVKFISRDNKGIIYTRNEGVAMSQCQYIALMDADDISLPERLEKQLEFLMNNSDYVAVGTSATFIDKDGAIICPFRRWLTHDAIDGSHIQGVGGAIVNPSAMIKKNAILKVGGYSELYTHAEDFDLWLKLAEVGKLSNLKERLFLYRQHMESVGYSKRLSQVISARKAVESACKRRNIKYKEIGISETELPSLVDTYCKWSWWALNSSNIATARKYAIKAFLKKPYDLSVCKLLLCSLRGY